MRKSLVKSHLACGVGRKKTGKSLLKKLLPKLGIVKSKTISSLPPTTLSPVGGWVTTIGNSLIAGDAVNTGWVLVSRTSAPIKLKISYTKSSTADFAGTLKAQVSNIPSFSGAVEYTIGTAPTTEPTYSEYVLTINDTSEYVLFQLIVGSGVPSTIFGTRIVVKDFYTNLIISNNFLIEGNLA